MYVYFCMYVDVLTEQPFFLPVFVLLFMNEWSQTLISISISEYDQGYSLECHQFCLDLCGLFLLKLKMIIIIIYNKSLVNTNLFYTNFTNTHFQKVLIPHLPRIYYIHIFNFITI